MLVIRAPQLAVFDRAQQKRFEDSAVEYLRAHFPAGFERRGESQVRASLPEAVARAAKYGIDRRADLHAWIGLEWLLGERFENLPENAWMLAFLNSPILASEGKVPAMLEELKHHPDSLGGGAE